MAELTVSIPDDLSDRVREAAAQRGGTLSEFVCRTLQKELFWQAVQQTQSRNADLSPEEADRLANEALDCARAAGA